MTDPSLVTVIYRVQLFNKFIPHTLGRTNFGKIRVINDRPLTVDMSVEQSIVNRRQSIYHQSIVDSRLLSVDSREQLTRECHRLIVGDDHLEVHSSAILSDLVRDAFEAAAPAPTSDSEPEARFASPTDSSVPLSPAAATVAVTAASSTTMTAVTFPSNETSETSDGSGWAQLMRVTTPSTARGRVINDDSRPTRTDAVTRETGSGNRLVRY